MLTKLWTFLNTDLQDLKLSQAVEIIKTGTDAAKAVFDLAKTVKEQQPKVETLKPYIGEISSLLDVLNAPFAQIVKDAIPFAPLAITVLKLVCDYTHKEPSLEQCVALVSQGAYLESLQVILKDTPGLLDRLGEAPVSEAIAQQIKQLGNLEIDDREARKAILYFHESKLAAAFNGVLQARLQQAGLESAEAQTLTEQVARRTNEYLPIKLAETDEGVERLVKWYSMGGAKQLETYLSIDEYLDREIYSKPNEIVFDETELGITYQDLYVPLKARRLDRDGRAIQRAEFVVLQEWVEAMLQDPTKQQQVLFIQGEAGRGKSVFCRMFAAQVAQKLHPTYTPIVIRLRHLKELENTLSKTLESDAVLQTYHFVTSDSGWLTDKKTRFLFLLDGFDELLLEGRASGGLKEFLQQVEAFQKNSHHRFLITGRPLSLQGIERLMTQTDCLERVELQAMDDSLRQTWLNNWKTKIGDAETAAFQGFLQACPDDIRDNLAREPLLLYLLARMHREQRLNAQMFTGTEGIRAKILIYDEAVKWVLEKQRQDENFRLTGLSTEDLRHCLTEAALCVVQSGNESARLFTLEARLKDSNNPVAALMNQARQETGISDDRALNNLLTAFYIKPASGDKGGSVEFAHKSFGEFLFAERLADSLLEWTFKVPQRRGDPQDRVSTPDMQKQLYDLLGYGGLTPEIVSYLMALLEQSTEFEPIYLFQRLEDFYLRWCDGEFIDADPPTLPQQTMRRLKEQLLDSKNPLGQRQVDVYTGLNVMILLLDLHRYAQNRDDLKDQIVFYPSGQVAKGEHLDRLLQVIHYSDCLNLGTFSRVAGSFLASANLSSAYLSSADLSSADLSSADLSSANLSSANLSSANLSSANLSSTNLSSTNLSSAYLSSADLSSADLSSANLSRANLSSANLSSANLDSANLDSANLNSANLDSANLDSANLFRRLPLQTPTSTEPTSPDANLESAYLESAYLESAYLSNANPRQRQSSTAPTSYQRQPLDSANLDSANLDRANLSRRQPLQRQPLQRHPLQRQPQRYCLG
jgi:uncharacterized protein YjbI with pentapeptide repeats